MPLKQIEERKAARYSDQDFIYDDHVPVLDCHDAAEYGEDIVFNKVMLEKCVANTNYRIDDTADWAPIYCGHTDQESPESEQGELLGFATKFEMGTIGELDPRDCIYANFAWLKNKYNKAKELTRRSVELWFDAGEPIIDAIAAIKRRPQRNLGILFSKKISRKVNKNMSDTEPEDDKKYNDQVPDVKVDATPLMPNDWTKAIESEVVKYCDAYMKKMKMADGEKEDSPLDNVDMGDEEKMDESKKTIQKAAKEQQDRQFIKLLAQVKEQEEKLEVMETKARLASRKSDLCTLELAGYMFDMGEELEYVADMSDESYLKYTAKIKKNFNKAPVNIKLPGAVLAPAPTLTPDDVYKKLNYARVKTYAAPALN